MRTFLLLALLIAIVPEKCAIAQCREYKPATLFSWNGERQALGELPAIATDRPDFTEASSTVGYRVAQLESGYTFVRGADIDTHSWGEPLLRVGALANWLEFRLAASPISEQALGTTISGTEDLYLGTKLWLTQQEGFLPEVALMPQMTVPTGSSSFTDNQVLPGINLLYGWDITDSMTFAGSTQFNRAVDNVGTYDEWAQSLTVGKTLGENFGSYFEWFAFLPHLSVSTTTQHYLNGGITYAIGEDVQLDVRIGKGLSESADDYFAGAGISMRWR